MSRVGDCNDNAPAESFIGSLKCEWSDHKRHANVDAARRSAMQYVQFYNHVRVHQNPGYLPPDKYETRHHERHQQAVHAPADL